MSAADVFVLYGQVRNFVEKGKDKKPVRYGYNSQTQHIQNLYKKVWNDFENCFFTFDELELYLLYESIYKKNIFIINTYDSDEIRKVSDLFFSEDVYKKDILLVSKLAEKCGFKTLDRFFEFTDSGQNVITKLLLSKSISPIFYMNNMKYLKDEKEENNKKYIRIKRIIKKIEIILEKIKMARTINFDSLRNNAKKVETSENKGKKDPRFYDLKRNGEGNALATIRFLPQVENEDTYFVKVWNHFFSENGKYFVSECPTTIGQPCPVCEHNIANWKSYNNEEKKRSRKLSYITNIYVVKDKETPAREGKNYLFRYGTKIQQKITNVINPNTEEDPDAKPYNIFDFKKGKNFKLKIKTVSDYANYDDSEFVSEPSSLGDDKKIAEIDKGIYPLSEFVPSADKFDYNELKQKFLVVIGSASNDNISSVPPKANTSPVNARTLDDEDESVDSKSSKKVSEEDEDDFFKVD